jgi:hypothetical protein
MFSQKYGGENGFSEKGRHSRPVENPKEMFNILEGNYYNIGL